MGFGIISQEESNRTQSVAQLVPFKWTLLLNMCFGSLLRSVGYLCNLTGDIFQGWTVKSPVLPVPQTPALNLYSGHGGLPRERWQHRSHWDGVCACIEEERKERKLNLPAHLLENTSKGTSLAFYSSLASAHLFSHFPDEPALLGGLRAHTAGLWEGGWYTGRLCSLPVCFVGFPDIWKPLTVSHIYHQKMSIQNQQRLVWTHSILGGAL